MESDAESYVRASALRALSTMIKLKNLRDNINNLNLLTKTIFILRTESEGIVRREAVLLINQIYLNFSEK